MVTADRDLDERALQAHLTAQDGVVSRSQVRECGGGDLLVRRRLRRREWARLHEGVYVDHTGPPSWRQRAWAAVLVHEPAALAGASALRAHGVESVPETGDVEIVVDRTRRVDAAPGVSVAQVTGLESVALLHLSPPRVRVEHAALTVAARAGSDDAVVAVVAEVVRLRRTTTERLREALADRPRLRHAALLREVLADVAVGAESALERRYLRDVERAHGLPAGHRRRRRPARTAGSGATSSTPTTTRSSSWTAGWGTSGRPTGGPTSSATSSPSPRAASRSGPGGARSSSRAGWRRWSAPSSPCGAGAATSGRAGRAARSHGRGSRAPGDRDPRLMWSGRQNEVTTATPGARPTSTSAAPASSRVSSRVTRSAGRSRPAAISDSIAG